MQAQRLVFMSCREPAATKFLKGTNHDPESMDLDAGQRGFGGGGNVAGPAAQASLMPADVLLSVNGTPVKTVDQVRGFPAICI